MIQIKKKEQKEEAAMYLKKMEENVAARKQADLKTKLGHINEPGLQQKNNLIIKF